MEEEKPNNQNGNPLDNLDEETQNQIQELQFLEQSFQQLMMQKQAFQNELTQSDIALEEIEKAEGELSKIVANNVIIKTTKEKLNEELNNKKDLLEKRLKNIEDQEKQFSEKLKSLREDVMSKIQNKQ